MKMGAFVDFNRSRKYSEDDYILPETPPFSWLLRKTQEEDANNNSAESNGEASALEDGVNNNKENENNSRRSKPQLEEQQQSKAVSGAGLINSQRPSRWSVSPTRDEEKLLKELVSGETIQSEGGRCSPVFINNISLIAALSVRHHKHAYW